VWPIPLTHLQVDERCQSWQRPEIRSAAFHSNWIWNGANITDQTMANVLVDDRVVGAISAISPSPDLQTIATNTQAFVYLQPKKRSDFACEDHGKAVLSCQRFVFLKRRQRLGYSSNLASIDGEDYRWSAHRSWTL
jgi:hypothetical protein